MMYPLVSECLDSARFRDACSRIFFDSSLQR